MTGLPVFIGAGKYDPLCTKEESEELHRCLLDSGASASVFGRMGAISSHSMKLNRLANGTKIRFNKKTLVRVYPD